MKRSLPKEESQLASKRQKAETEDINTVKQNKDDASNNDIDENEEEQMLQYCESCEKPIDIGQEAAAHCETCDMYWCYNDDCWATAGSFCAYCSEFECDDCEELQIRPCNKCLEIYCAECGGFKSGRGGKELCSGCQPGWMKNK